MDKEEKNKKDIAFDDLYKHVASFGILQAILLFGSCSVILQVSSNYGLLVFAMGTPNYHCDTTSTSNLTCPPNECCHNCTSYVFDGPFRSIVNEWDLLCNKAYLQAIVQSCVYAGDIVGSVTFGIVSDWYGRKKTMFLGCAIMSVSVFAASFVDCISFLGFLLFWAGFGGAGVIVSQYIYFMEIMGPKHRLTGTVIYELYWAVGAMGLALLSYLIRDWRMLMMTASLPAMVLLLSWRFVPETPRWLLAHGRVDETVQVLMKCGSKDNQPLNQEKLRSLVEEVKNNQDRLKKADRKYTVLDLVKTPKLRKWTIALSINWFVTANLGHGMFLYVTNLSGDIYLNVVIMRLIVIIAQPIVWLIIRRFGRRVPHASELFLTAVLCIIAVMIPSEYATSKSAIFIVAYCVGSCVWTTVNMFIGELYPTVLRTKGHGCCSMSGRIGGLLAPYITMMAGLPGVDKSAPVIIFAVLAGCGCIATYWIPETLHANMHQTIEEAEAAKEDYDIICCRKKPYEPVVEGVPMKTEKETGEPLLE